jgi:protein O-mannosyl-transferase
MTRRRRRESARRSAPARHPTAERATALRARDVATLAALFAVLALAVHWPSMHGPFLSDDMHYVATNPYVHDLSAANLLAILDPRSPATVFVVNYAPVHLLLHGVSWQLFGEQTTGHHVVNVLLHALGSALLAALFVRAGLGRTVAAGAALLFLLHPANVEAVAWISQAKTPAAFVLSMAALLAHRRRPALGALCFGLALLAKPTAAFALPVAGLLDWTREGRVRWSWLSLWAVLLASYFCAEFWTHQRSGAVEPIDEDLLVRLRSSAAIAARYAWMSATSRGVSTFHEPAPVRSWLDPLWLAGATLAIGVVVRSVVVLRRRSVEAAFWVWAVVSFLPISQVFPFLYPMADRYLYFILPGLLGAALFVARDVASRSARRVATPDWLPHVATVAALALAVAFAAHSFERAGVWASPVRVLADAAVHYPDGRMARLVEARRAAQAGDADTAIAALRRARQLGYNRHEQLRNDPALAPLQGDPRFEALVHEIASSWVTRFEAKTDATQIELRTLAMAYLARGDRDVAIGVLERALAQGGPIDDRLRDEIAQLRALSR